MVIFVTRESWNTYRDTPLREMYTCSPPHYIARYQLHRVCIYDQFGSITKCMEFLSGLVGIVAVETTDDSLWVCISSEADEFTMDMVISRFWKCVGALENESRPNGPYEWVQVCGD